MQNLHETSLLPEILKTLIREWLSELPIASRPNIEVMEDDHLDAAYVLGPVVTIVCSREYRIVFIHARKGSNFTQSH